MRETGVFIERERPVGRLGGRSLDPSRLDAHGENARPENLLRGGSTFGPSMKRLAAASFVAVAGVLSTKAGGTWVGLGWTWPGDDTIVGYNIYYGGESGNYTNTLDVPGVWSTNTIVTGLATNVTYYFAATTYNSSGVQSPFSNEVFGFGSTNAIPTGLPAAPTGLRMAWYMDQKAWRGLGTTVPADGLVTLSPSVWNILDPLLGPKAATAEVASNQPRTIRF